MTDASVTFSWVGLNIRFFAGLVFLFSFCYFPQTKNILETYLRFMNRKRRVSEKNSADVRLRDILVSTSRPQFLKNFSHPTPILSTRDFMDSSSLPHLSLSSIDASSISSEELASPSSAFRRVKENPTYLSSLSSILERSVENIFSHVSSTDFDKLSSLLRSVTHLYFSPSNPLFFSFLSLHLSFFCLNGFILAADRVHLPCLSNNTKVYLLLSQLSALL